MSGIPSKPVEDLTKLARDIQANLVFTDRHCRNPDLLPQLFLPICLGGLENFTEEQRNDIGMLYEYEDQRPPGHYLNGYPVFASVKLLSQADAKVVWEKVSEIQKAVDAICGTSNSPSNPSASDISPNESPSSEST